MADLSHPATLGESADAKTSAGNIHPAALALSPVVKKKARRPNPLKVLFKLLFPKSFSKPGGFQVGAMLALCLGKLYLFTSLRIIMIIVLYIFFNNNVNQRVFGS